MKSVLEYQNYREYLSAAFAERKARAGFTWREFAKLAGYASPVYLKLVADGKSSLSELGVERVASALGLSGKELAYFRLLVRFNHEKDAGAKKALFVELRQIAESCKVAVLGADQFDYYQDWYNPVLRELAPAMSAASEDEMAAKLQPAVSPAKVRKSLALLCKAGLLKQDSEGRWQQTDHNITSGSEVSSLAVRGMHSQMGALALDSLESVPTAERDISGLTLGLSAQGFERAREELREFRRRLVEIAQADAAAERVYRLNLQLFPLTGVVGDGGEHV